MPWIVHQEGFGSGVDAPIDRLAPVRVDGDDIIGVAQLLYVLHRLGVLVLPIHADDGDDIRWRISSKTLCSRRHSTHQVPHTLKTYQWPLRSLDLMMWLASVRLGRANSGAGLPSKGEMITPKVGRVFDADRQDGRRAVRTLRAEGRNGSSRLGLCG